eukprot:m.152101 g.152101  ORF g.152101 m.152101 type:complete len:211 (-) comp30791_c0_seq1:61-693(-)
MSEAQRIKSDGSGRVIKYKPRFPQSRIKKILQADEEVGRVAQGTPVVISRAVELFLEQLVGACTKELNDGDGTVTAINLKHAINNQPKFDYLKEIVQGVSEQVQSSKEADGRGKRKRASVSTQSRSVKATKISKKPEAKEADIIAKSEPQTSSGSSNVSIPSLQMPSSSAIPPKAKALELEMEMGMADSAPILMSTTSNADGDDSDEDYD